MRIEKLKPGQQKFINGTRATVKSKIDWIRKSDPSLKFTTEAREGGRLVTRVA